MSRYPFQSRALRRKWNKHLCLLLTRLRGSCVSSSESSAQPPRFGQEGVGSL